MPRSSVLGIACRLRMPGVLMQKPTEASQLSTADSVNSSATKSDVETFAWLGLGAIGRNVIQDTVAGLIASIILIANIVSFGALMFPGQLNVGIPVAIWAMLIGSAVGGTWIALATSLPPLATAIDSPTGTVLVLLSAMTGGLQRAAVRKPQSRA